MLIYVRYIRCDVAPRVPRRTQCQQIHADRNWWKHGYSLHRLGGLPGDRSVMPGGVKNALSMDDYRAKVMVIVLWWVTYSTQHSVHVRAEAFDFQSEPTFEAPLWYLNCSSALQAVLVEIVPFSISNVDCFDDLRKFKRNKRVHGCIVWQNVGTAWPCGITTTSYYSGFPRK